MKKSKVSFLAGMLFMLTASAALARPASSTKYRTKPAPNYNYTMPAIAPTPAPTPETPVTIDRHWFGTVLYSSANQLLYKGTILFNGAATPFTATETTATAFGFSGGYLQRHGSSFGYSADMTFEMQRASQGLVGNGGGLNVKGVYDKAPANSLLTTALNGNYSIGESFYLFGGLNFPFIFTSGDQSMTGQMGYQVGAGYVMTENISVDAQYRTLKMKGSINNPALNLTIDEATFSGMILTVRYLFK
jgi:opacity protein-like surface antigen